MADSFRILFGMERIAQVGFFCQRRPQSGFRPAMDFYELPSIRLAVGKSCNALAEIEIIYR